MVDSVIGRIARPACAKAKNGGCERQDAASFRTSSIHGQIHEFSAVCEFTKYNQKDDQGWDPGPEFIYVHHFVAEDCDEPGCCCNDDDACVAGHVCIDGVDQLSAHNDIDGGPAYAGKNVEAGD